MSAKEITYVDLHDNKLFLIGCDEERIAHGISILDHVFARCITYFIKDSGVQRDDNTPAPTPPCLHEAPTVPPTSSNIRPAIPTCANISVPSIAPPPRLH